MYFAEACILDWAGRMNKLANDQLVESGKNKIKIFPFCSCFMHNIIIKRHENKGLQNETSFHRAE